MQGGVHMKVAIHHRCTDYDSYRAARVKSLFNVESGANFKLETELPIDAQDWHIIIPSTLYNPVNTLLIFENTYFSAHPSFAQHGSHLSHSSSQ